MDQRSPLEGHIVAGYAHARFNVINEEGRYNLPNPPVGNLDVSVRASVLGTKELECFVGLRRRIEIIRYYRGRGYKIMQMSTSGQKNFVASTTNFMGLYIKEVKFKLDDHYILKF